MKAEFRGFIDVDRNAVFAIQHKNNYGFPVFTTLLELKSNNDADFFAFGQSYELEVIKDFLNDEGAKKAENLYKEMSVQ